MFVLRDIPASRNNVVMSAGKRSCPHIMCYLLSVSIYKWSRTTCRKRPNHAGHDSPEADD